MPKIRSTESSLLFILGAILGKTIGAVISSVSYLDFLFTSGLSDIFLEEFTTNLVSGNLYHIALAAICGIILVVWKSEEIFE